MDADVLVVGGGPIGLGAAIEARLAGMSALVLEPRPCPVDKACGEGLMPSAVAALARLGVDPPGVPFHGIDYLTARAAARAPFRAGPGRGVRRVALSAALSARAEAVGVQRAAVRASAPVQGDGWVEASGLRGRWLLAADGLHSAVRRGLGLDVRQPPSRARYGLRRHYRLAPWTDYVEVHWSRRAEAYVTPVASDLVGIAVLCPAGAGYDEWLRQFPALAARVASAAVGPVLGAGPLRQKAARRVIGRVLLVGDAAGYVDALTGEGIAVGLAAAHAAVRCIAEGRPEDYEQAWRAATRQYRVLTGALLWAAQRPLLRPRIVPAASTMPAVFAGIVNRLGDASLRP